ncbi:MAG: hypothetical protein ACREDP_25160, partial [Bradyrhizobium sp.]
MAGLLDSLLGVAARVLGRFQPWHKYPTLIAVPTLAGLRVNMRQRNLFDTETEPRPQAAEPAAGSMDFREVRTAD